MSFATSLPKKFKHYRTCKTICGSVLWDERDQLTEEQVLQQYLFSFSFQEKF